MLIDRVINIDTLCEKDYTQEICIWLEEEKAEQVEGRSTHNQMYEKRNN